MRGTSARSGIRGALPAIRTTTPDKDEYRTYSLQLAKDFHLPRFQRIQTSLSYLGSDNTDRFSKYSFGFFGGTSLRGFRSGALRAEEAVTSRFAYGYVFGDVFRLEVIYEDARVKDAAAGLDWAYFSGAGLSGEAAGPVVDARSIRRGHARRGPEPRPDGRRPEPHVPQDLLGRKQEQAVDAALAAREERRRERRTARSPRRARAAGRRAGSGSRPPRRARATRPEGSRRAARTAASVGAASHASRLSSSARIASCSCSIALLTPGAGERCSG